jgi:hypothetical protein
MNASLYAALCEVVIRSSTGKSAALTVLSCSVSMATVTPVYALTSDGVVRADEVNPKAAVAVTPDTVVLAGQIEFER